VAAGIASSAGVPAGVVAATLAVPYNDTAADVAHLIEAMAGA
jgi:glutamate-1-semialdehyde aminotransferase